MATNPPIPQIDPQTAALIAAQQQPWLGAPQTAPAPSGPPQGMPTPTPPPSIAPAPPHVEMAAPSTQGSAPTRPGPLKNFLTSFLYGAGQALKEHAGLPTDQQVAVQNAGIANTQANTQAINAQRAAVLAETQRQNQPFTVPDTDDYPAGIRGITTTQGNFEKVIAPIFARNQGALDTANVRAGAQMTVADTNAGARVQAAKVGATAREYSADRMGGVAQQRLAIARAGLNLRQATTEANLYGTDLNHNPLPGTNLLPDGTPVGRINALNVRPTGAERGKADMANSAAEQLGTIKGIMQNHPALFGPGYGQASAFRQWIGSQDPDAQRFIAARTIAGDHLAGTFGGRSEAALNALDTAIGQFKDNPNAALAGIDQLTKANTSFQRAGTPRVSMGQPSAPAGTQAFTDGGITYHIPVGQINDFKKDHPNAR